MQGISFLHDATQIAYNRLTGRRGLLLESGEERKRGVR